MRDVMQQMGQETMKGVARLLALACRAVLVLAITASSALAHFVDVAVSSIGIPFLLDDDGNVWAFKEPLSLGGIAKLPGLSEIQDIAPFAAVNKQGDVFVWSLDRRTAVTTPDVNILAVYTVPKRLTGVRNTALIASSGQERLVIAEKGGDLLELEAIPDTQIRDAQRSLGIAGYKPLARISLGRDVKWMNATASHTVAIFSGGEAVSFDDGVANSQSARIVIEAPREASAIHVSRRHSRALVLLDDGTVLFFGNCTPRLSYQASENTLRLANGIALPISEVTEMRTAGGWIIFVRRDGSVWSTYGLLSEYDAEHECGKGVAKISRLRGMTPPALKVVGTNRGLVFALGTDRSLWIAGLPGSGNFSENFVRVLEGR